MKSCTIILIVSDSNTSIKLIDFIYSDSEIERLESLIQAHTFDPLHQVYQFRASEHQKLNQFADQIEQLITQPCQKVSLIESGVHWLRSLIKLEKYQQTEKQAAMVLAHFAYQLFQKDPNNKAFELSGLTNTVKIKVYDTSELNH